MTSYFFCILEPIEYLDKSGWLWRITFHGTHENYFQTTYFINWFYEIIFPFEGLNKPNAVSAPLCTKYTCISTTDFHSRLPCKNSVNLLTLFTHLGFLRSIQRPYFLTFCAWSSFHFLSLEIPSPLYNILWPILSFGSDYWSGILRKSSPLCNSPY